MAKALEIKPEEELARSYVDRLILEQLTEMESAVKLSELADRLSDEGIGLATVRALLASNPDVFAYHERRWVPASRIQAFGRPFAEALALVLYRYGAPMSLDLVIAEVSRIRNEDPELVAETVERIAKKDPHFLLTKNQVSLTAWSFVATDEPHARALALNQVSEEEFETAKAKLADIDWRSETAIADALAKIAPIRLKTLGAVAYSVLNPQDSKRVLLYDTNEFFAKVLATPGYIMGPGQVVHAEEDAKRWISATVRAADKFAPSVEVEDAAPIEIKTEDIDRLVAKILSNEQSTTSTRLLEEFYEITPSNKTFPDDLINIHKALSTSSQVQWVVGDRYRKAGDLPEYIAEVPEPFQFVTGLHVDEEGDPIDVELTDEGLSQTLRKLLQHPLAMDVLDEDIQPAPKQHPDSLRLVLKSIHRELGTFPLAQIPTGWLDAKPNIQELIFVDPSLRELQVWVNHEARLMYGLFDWWYEQSIESGAVFTITKTNKQNVLEFSWMDQPDPVVYISSQRMEELRNIGVEGEDKSTLDLLIQVMQHWPKGTDYLTLLAEANVVRRCSRRLVASILSSYQCFYQRSGSPVWHFDAKKVELGFDKTKKKFIKK